MSGYCLRSSVDTKVSTALSVSVTRSTTLVMLALNVVILVFTEAYYSSLNR
jgi:hypothetical protein